MIRGPFPSKGTTPGLVWIDDQGIESEHDAESYGLDAAVVAHADEDCEGAEWWVQVGDFYAQGKGGPAPAYAVFRALELAKAVAA